MSGTGNGGLPCPAYLPVSPRRQASLVGQPQLQVDLAFPLGWLGAVPQLGHHLSEVPLILFHSSVGLSSRYQVQWHLVRPRGQGARPSLPLPFALGVPGLAWPQEDRDGKKEQLRKKARTKVNGQRPEPSLSLGQGLGLGQRREASALATLYLDTCVVLGTDDAPPPAPCTLKSFKSVIS